MESALAQAADVTRAVSDRDAKSLEALGVRLVRVLGHCFAAALTRIIHEKWNDVRFLI
jgi:hypothetical protein